MEVKNEKLKQICGALNLVKTLDLNKRMGKVGALCFLLQNVNEDFRIEKSIKKIARDSEIDYVTVQSTFNSLYERNILRRISLTVCELDFDELQRYMYEEDILKN